MLPNDFITMLVPAAKAIQAATGMPASFMIAQGAVESAWFNSQLAQQAFNLFGIKAIGGWTGDTITFPTREVVNGKSIMIQAAFRKYPDLQSGLQDHADFLAPTRPDGTPSRYAPAYAHTDDSCAFAQAVADAGYASDPHYAQTIISIINSHNLKQYDML